MTSDLLTSQSSSSSSPSLSSLRSELQKLDQQKSAIEKEAESLTNRLNGPSFNFIGMSGNLVDEQGFPRGDVDLLEVRKARNRVICLKKDHSDLMMQIEAKLHELHSIARETGSIEKGVDRTRQELDSANAASPSVSSNQATASSPIEINLSESALEKVSTFAEVTEVRVFQLCLCYSGYSGFSRLVCWITTW
jgi:predicted  nucleic acid-binding Zn-ribbon protein